MDAPKYATGGIVSPVVVMFGTGDPEAIVPVRRGDVRYAVPAWRYNPTPRLCHPGCRHCTPPKAAA